jgi:outer membrane receptor protein involved in Fe transport
MNPFVIKLPQGGWFDLCRPVLGATNHCPRHLAAVLGTLAICLSVPAFGQTQSDQSAADDDEIFILSPFEVVAGDVQGYLASNSVSGTRLAVQIRDLPMTLDVLTAELLADQSATDFNSAITYSAGIFSNLTDAGTGGGANTATSAERSPSARAGVGNFRNNAVAIRGFNTPFQLRNGFRIGGFIPSAGINLGGLTDTVSVERIEIVKGPQSLLYGLSVLSGIANIIPKTPLDHRQYSFKTTVGSYDRLRFEMDATGPLAKDLSYRFFTALDDRGSRLDFRDTSIRYYGLQLQQYFLERRLRLFVELQYGTQRESGIGSTSVRDTYSQGPETNIWNFRNEFGEFVDWQRDPNFGNKEDDRSYNFGGPDPYYHRKEINAMFDTEFKPLKNHNFWIKSGVLYGKQDIDERSLVVDTRTNSAGRGNYFDLLRIAPTSEISFNDILANPGVVSILRNPDPASGLRMFPRDQVYPGVLVNAADVPRESLSARDDYKSINYHFRRRPTDAENLQVRNEATYIFRTPWPFSDAARHSLLFGRLDLQDTVDYVSGGDNFDRIDWGLEPGRFPEPFHMNPLNRKGVLDTTPIRYAGQGFPEGGTSRQIKTWFTGHYFAYNGSLFNERVNLILGVRRDRYQVWEGIYDRVSWRDSSYRPGDSTTQEDLFKQFNPEWDPFNPIVTVGAPEASGGFNGYNFETAQEENTKMGAVSYRLSDLLSGYLMYGEGISPNTGLKDGNWDAIEAERTTSHEIGIKFDFLDRRISGSVALWRIRRSNVIWETSFAPFPGAWADGPYHIERRAAGNPADENRFFNPNLRSDSPGELFPNDPEISYWVNASFLDELGISYKRVPNPETRTFDYPPGIVSVASPTAVGTTAGTFVLIEPSRIPEDSRLGEAMENAFNAPFVLPEGADWNQNFGVPFDWRFFQDMGNNPSMVPASGPNATLEDESRGFDLNLMLRLMENWQVVVNYSYIERKVTSPFNLAAVTHPETGENLGTPYDRWVYFLGRDAFEDPSDPTTLTGGIVGISLFFAPQHSASIWNKYTFRDGRLEGLELGLGARYVSESQTSIPIGGRDAMINPYRTPPVPSRFVMDGMLAYGWNWGDTRWRAQLNVFNLTNDTEGHSYINYIVPEGQTNAGEVIRRRTLRYYTPTTFRLSLGLYF